MAAALALALALAGQCGPSGCPAPIPIVRPYLGPPAPGPIVWRPAPPPVAAPRPAPAPAPVPVPVAPAVPRPAPAPGPATEAGGAAPISVAPGRNFGLALDKMGSPGAGKESWRSHGAEAHRFVAEATGTPIVGAPADQVDDSHKYWLTIVGPDAGTIAAGLPPAVAESFHVNSYPSDHWRVKQHGFRPGISVQRPDGTRILDGAAFRSADRLDVELGRLHPAYRPRARPGPLDGLLDGLSGGLEGPLRDGLRRLGLGGLACGLPPAAAPVALLALLLLLLLPPRNAHP